MVPLLYVPPQKPASIGDRNNDGCATVPSVSTEAESFAANNAPLRAEPSSLARVSKTAIATLVTAGVWSAITWKPIWIAAGPTGDEILTVALLLVSAAWPVSFQIGQTRRERPVPGVSIDTQLHEFLPECLV